jgi:4-amino-4-deoxy-L-arabinose transferase-like glycosyltransferase
VSTSSSTVSLPRPMAGRARLRARALNRPRPELAALLVLAGVLYLWSLSRNGFANEYYSAAVRSMSESWHAFLYGSFDSSGVMTVDKPPLALWVQALSVRAFGYSSWSMLVPQALMGVGSVALVYDLTRRRFGRAAGFGAGLVLALTPVTVAISRHNNPDALLVLCVTAALWFMVRALEDGRTRWLVWAGVAIGLGFEAKMGAALLVVPALAAAWLWVAPRGRLAALRQLGLGGAAMAVVGLAWPVLVWLTPASDRPWISGTSDNSVWSLIFGYNGLGRLTGQQGAPGGGGPGGGGGGGGAFGGDSGVLRLLNESLGGQAGWLLGFALVAGIAVAVLSRLQRDDARTGWIIAVGGVFLTIAAAFSQATGIFHPYYVSELAPFTAALVGAGIAVIAKGGMPARVVGPLAFGAGIVTELIVLGKNPGQLEWVPALLIVVGGMAAVALALGPAITRPARMAALVAAVGVLLMAPGAWAFETLGHATSGTFPAGGPASAGFGGRSFAGGAGGGPPGFAQRNGGGQAGGLPQGGLQGGGLPQGGLQGGGLPPGLRQGGGTQGGNLPPGLTQGGTGGTQSQGGFGGPGGGGGMFGGNTQSLTEALAYVKQHGGGTLAVSSQSGAAEQLISSGADVAALGGFSGQESQVSIDWLANAVDQGRIRWVLTDGSGGGGMFRGGRIGSSEVMAAVQEVGTESSSVSGLYDLQGHADELRALAS